MSIRNVAILTNFQDFNPGYSLTGIVLDQCEMLLKYGHNVHLLVNENFRADHVDQIHRRLLSVGEEVVMERFSLRKIVPFAHLTDYISAINWSTDHKYTSVRVCDALVPYFKENHIDVAFTHDWIFTGWNLPYAGGIRFTSSVLPNMAWLHWVHSVPSVMRDWWELKAYGPAHRIVFPNASDRRRVAEQFRTSEQNVAVIPHIKDPRTWYKMSDETKELIDAYPAILSAEMVQFYPASCDRLAAKGVQYLIKIFGAWKAHGISVFLAIANQWATGRQRKEDISKYIKMARDVGLTEEEFCFTSEFDKKYETGIPSNMLMELMHLQSVFIFPTREESFGLVGPEAALSGCLMVLNGSLTMMREVFGNMGMYFDFGSFHSGFEPVQGMDKYLEAVAMVIFNKYKLDPSICTKVICRQQYNMDYLYRSSYVPAMNDIVVSASNIKVTERDIESSINYIEEFRKLWESEQEKKRVERKNKENEECTSIQRSE